MESEQHTPKESAARKLACLIGHLCETLGRLTTEPSCHQSQGFVTEQDLEAMEGRIIMAIQKAVETVVANFNTLIDGVNTSVDSLQNTVAGLTQDNQTMLDAVKAIQTSPGPISAEDQTALDTVQSKLQSTADRLKAVTAALASLDALTPPPVNPANA